MTAGSKRGLTRVTVLFLPERVNDRVRFGTPAAERIIDRRCRVDLFEPGAVFGYVQWRANRYGTEHWRLWVLQAVPRGERAETVPGVAPAAHIWLSAGGVARVTRTLALIDAIEAQALDPAALPESYWRTAHNRIAAGLEPRIYAPAEADERRLRGEMRP
ncbi:DUF2840 domain-containing protein [Lichenicoccus sp.]|uniref:DUF2840 domain-containing protein n=1 Tax=Lichenicoccus sp. TaxID=2781899 RepID=UPI003D0FA1C4